MLCMQHRLYFRKKVKHKARASICDGHFTARKMKDAPSGQSSTTSSRAMELSA